MATVVLAIPVAILGERDGGAIRGEIEAIAREVTHARGVALLGEPPVVSGLIGGAAISRNAGALADRAAPRALETEPEER